MVLLARLATCAAAMSSHRAEKRELRKQLNGVLQALPADQVASASARACQRVLAHPAVDAGDSISVYMAMPHGECQTTVLLEELFRRGKRIFVPRVDGKGAAQMSMVRMESLEQLRALERNSWGIPEPRPPPPGAPAASPEERGELVDVVLVPAVAFDSRCHRLGHGRGYYDSYLARLSFAREAAQLPRATAIGLGLQEQLVQAVPVDEHDVRLDAVCLPGCLLLAGI